MTTTPGRDAIDALNADDSTAVGDDAALIAATEALTLAAATPQTFESTAPDIFRDPRTGEIIDLEQYAETPRRKRGTITVSTTDSFAQYLNAHRLDGTTLYADPDALTVVAVINDHGPEAAGHRDHRAALSLTKTPAQIRWFGAHGKYMAQETFAQLVEDGLDDITDPSGAELLELAQTMQATKDAAFRSGIRLATGQVQFSYVENLNAAAGPQGDMVIPEIITLMYPPFFGAEPMTIRARLRYRLQGGELALGVWLIRHVEALRAAFDTELGRLTELTAGTADDGLRPLWGAT